MRVLLCLAVLVGGCALVTKTSIPNRPVDERFTATGMSWASGRRMYFSIATFEDQGKVAVCGMVSREPGDTNDDRFDDWWLNTAKITLAGETVLNGVDFFNETGFSEGKAPLGSASCVRSATDWKVGFAQAAVDIAPTRTRFTLYD